MRRRRIETIKAENYEDNIAQLNKNDEEYEYEDPYLCDNFQYVKMITYDEKGYITGIYKGEN